MNTARAILLAGSAIALASCGADDVASPGDGVIVVPAPAAPAPSTPSPSTPSPSTPSPSTPSPSTPAPTGGAAAAADCPTGTTGAGVFDYGTADEGDDARICQITGRLTSTVTIPSPNSTIGNRIYELVGRVDVGTDTGIDGNAAGGQSALLEVKAGNIVFGRQPQDYLVVNRGSQLNSLGEREAPVVWTSYSNLAGAAGVNTLNDWGGIIIAGRANVVASSCTAAQQANNTCDFAVEGATGVNVGGNEDDDNSGTLTYSRIMYAGFIVSPGNERQGLTLGGVGSGTTMNHVQIHNSADDGIEWFGGSVNGSHLVFTGNDDDSLDVDNGYRGVNQFIIVTQRTAGSDHAIEADSGSTNEGLPRTDTTFANFTFVLQSDSDSNRGILLRGGGDYDLVNGVINYGTAGAECIEIFGNETLSNTTDAATQEDGAPEIHSVVMNCPTGIDGATGSSTATAAEEAAADDAADAIFAADANNDDVFTISLTNVVVNGANESAVTAFDIDNLANPNSFLVQTSYIGAVEQGGDLWFSPWACDLAGGPSCVTPPMPKEL